MTIVRKARPPEPKRLRVALVRGPVVNWMIGDRHETCPAQAIGVSGLFIATANPASPESQVFLAFEIPGDEMRLRATVRAVIPGRGMTVEYAPMGREERANLQALIKYLPAYTEELAPAVAAPPDADAPAAESARCNRRFPRITLSKALKVAWQCDGRREVGTASIIGEGGLFVTAAAPPAAGTAVRLLFDGASGVILTNAVVRDARPGKGMGLEFNELGRETEQRLNALLAAALLGGDAQNLPRGEDHMAGSPANRRHKRVELPRGLIVAWKSGKEKQTSIAPTVGRGGLFIATLDPAPAGSALRMLFEVPGGEILATGVVRDCRPGRGMGIEFTQMGREEITRLEGLLHKLLA